jgi:phospholipid/cholesterol/gamma-HCH transport system substrate-binding protein
MSRNIAETLMGGMVLAVAVWFFFNAYKGRGGDDSTAVTHLSAEFNDVTGIGIGSDVRIGGVKIGTVESISLNEQTYQAKIDFSVRSGITIPNDSDAAIVGESLLGGKFLAINPGGSEDALADGGKIEFTQSSISLEQLLGKFVFSAGGVDKEESETSSGDDDIELSTP